MHPPSRLRDALLLGAALCVTLAAAVGHFALPLDLENASMKAEGTPAAAAAEVREREFGSSRTLLAMLEPRAPSASAAPTDPDVSGWLARVGALPGVLASHVLPVSGPVATVVALETERGADASGELARALERLTPASLLLSFTGPSVGERAIARALAQEEARIVPLILCAFAVLLWAVYRRAALVLAALLPGLGAILWTGGLQYVLGLSIDPVSALVAPVVLTVGVAGAVHLIERHLALLASGLAPAAAPASAMRSLAWPMAFTSLTTVAGFLTLAPSSIPAVRGFGWIATLGVALTLLWTVGLVPSWLRLFASGPATVRRAQLQQRHGHPARHVRRMRRSAPWLVAAAALAGLFLGWRGLSIRVDTDPGRILPADHPFRLETERIAARVGAIETFELLLPPEQEPPGPLAAAALAEALGREPLVESLAGPPRRSPQGWVLASILLRPSGTAERAGLFERAERHAANAGFPRARASGDTVQVAQDSEALVHEQRRGFLATILLLWATMSVGLRSWRLGLLGLIPNVLPCIMLQGGLALAGRPLSVATAMIATVLLGLIVDDTIHFLDGYRAERRAGLGVEASIEGALAHAGRAIVITSVVLTVGFAAGLSGRLATTIEFAALCALTIVLALACDLLLLPALLLLPRLGIARPALHPMEDEPCAEITTS